MLTLLISTSIWQILECSPATLENIFLLKPLKLLKKYQTVSQARLKHQNQDFIMIMRKERTQYHRSLKVALFQIVIERLPNLSKDSLLDTVWHLFD